MSEAEQVLERARQAVNDAKAKAEGQRILEVLPQGHGSGLNADKLDGLHAKEIMEKAAALGLKGLSTLATGSAGGGSSGDATSIKGKTVDDTGIGDGKVLTYKTGSGKIEYETPAGAGDMTKAEFASVEAGHVDLALNSEKLEGSTKSEVQDHTPKEHGNEAHSPDFAEESHAHGHGDLSGVTADQHHAQAHAIDGPDHTGTLDDDQFEGSAADKANTCPSSFSSWASQPGTQRKVLTYDAITGKPKWDYLTCVDVGTPSPIPEISAFSVHPEGSYPDGTSGYGLVASSGEDQPHFALTYIGTPTVCSIAVSPVDADFPHSLDSPFTSHLGPNVDRRTSVGSAITFTATATVDGQEKTKQCTITYYNERMWGVSSEAAIDTSGEIDTFRAAQNKELSNSRAKSFTVAPGAGEYIYYIYRKALGTATFTVGGFEGGFEDPVEVSYTNARGFVEDYYVYRSTQANLGSTTVVVT